MGRASRPSNFFDAHARVREARIKFIQYAEFRYRQFLSDPQQKPHAAACIHLNHWSEYRDRFGFRGLETLNQQFEERVIPELDHRDICARFSDSALVLVLAANKGQHDIDGWVFRLIMHSLETNQLRIVFQPLLSSTSDGVRYYQAWARLISDRGKEVRARGFLDVARKAGVLARLNRWTLRRAMHFLATDRNIGSRIRLFVNASIDTFEPRTMQWLDQMLEDHPACRGEMIAEFDVFEFSNRKGEAIHLAQNLKRIGMHPGVTGIGTDNISRVEELLPNVDFVRMASGIADDIEQNKTLSNQFIDLLESAREHGVRIVMPELNSEQQIIDFWKLGVDLVQGDYIEHPRELLHSALAE